MQTPPVALTIAGSEATGGAGAQVDLKTFQEHGVFGCVALTCIVSFDPQADWGHRFVPVDAGVIADQLEVITTAYGPEQLEVVKIGMLGTPVTIETVAGALRERAFGQVVLDPVLICKGQEPGAALDTDNALKEHVLPLATFVTPNHFESMSLAGMESIETVEDLTEAARRIHERSGAAVLAKGGVHLPGDDAVDVYVDAYRTEILSSPKLGGGVQVAGAGCTLAAAVAARLALGDEPFEAARAAKEFVTRGIEARLSSAAPFDVVWQGA
ncbi:bifunctional hydroxymethylpyrimidine kinase/phosphomethylpyrimidine kinase [Ornithinimicrobium tianjinense]|uniref:pyridoxal kinase n=1 Tax=Ornithinimicrobium tianjinense TaxID=1195761 RepID=A0A917F918_9MICO|nr:bifunctional hydroxymethylpyrimidine kinase/phosphomethylpyrimidine kinase [Ornithinimicrobium tianjinense]GGF58819.1 hydroxymethylpyrimidine/phosphomethylpyrimidine kinase [Ornithinimicrobium tianjinense]